MLTIILIWLVSVTVFSLEKSGLSNADHSLLVTETEEFGHELPLRQAASGPSFNVAFNYEDEVYWIFSYRTQVSGSQLNSLLGDLYWNVWNSTKKSYLLADWKPLSRWQLAAGSLKVSERSVLSHLLPQQRQSLLVFVDSHRRPIYHVPLGKLCRQHKSNFFDVAQNKTSCHVKADFLQGWEDECFEISKSLSERIDRGFMSCSWARRAFQKQGCGRFQCP